MFLISAVFVFLVGVGLVLSTAVDKADAWHSSTAVELEGGRQLADVITSTGKLDCNEIEGADSDFCNDAEGSGGSESGLVVGGGSKAPTCSSWGSAYCAIGQVVMCSSGSTKRATGYRTVGSDLYVYSICIQD